MTDGEHTIRLVGLAKRFGTRDALRAIDLTLAGPQIVGVVGPDGAGKTTLLRVIAGLLEFTAVEARVLGYDLAGDVRAMKARLGYVPQAFGLHRDLSVMENLRFTARLHRLGEDELARRAAPLLARTGLAPFADRAAGALSGGMKQKLAIANALLPAPALLVLDEPTAGVDVVATGTPAELRARVAVELYRAWGEAPRAVARAARTLSYVEAVHATRHFTRVEVPCGRTPGTARVLADLAALDAVRLVEQVPVDMEATFLALARSSGS